MFFRRCVVAVAFMTVLLVPTSAHADDEVSRLYAYAQANGWGPREWAEFEHWVQVHEFLTWVESIVLPTGDLWDRVAVCETGGYQGAPPGVANWGMKGSTYSGGLGFANTTWTQFRWDWMPANAGDANREEQILVAERVRWELRPYGSLRGKWPACSVRLGTP